MDTPFFCHLVVSILSGQVGFGKIGCASIFEQRVHGLKATASSQHLGDQVNSGVKTNVHCSKSRAQFRVYVPSACS